MDGHETSVAKKFSCGVDIWCHMLIREGEMAELNNKLVCRQLLTYVHPESYSSSEEEETPQFHKGILKRIEKMDAR